MAPYLLSEVSKLVKVLLITLNLKIMKKMLLVSVLASLSVIIYSQDTLKVHELGLSFSSTSSFGIKYRFGHDDILYRLSLLSANISNDQYTQKSTPDLYVTTGGLSLSIGIQKNKTIKDNLGFYYGVDLIESGSLDRTKASGASPTNLWILNSGVGLVLGFKYRINEKFDLFAEVVPAVTYTYNKNVADQSIIGFSGSSSGANLTLAYKF
jgi:hypothetical protein